jgi:two-component system nitrogen regulation response regulator GlnG
VPRLLLIDDEPALIPRQLRQAFSKPDHEIFVARTAARGLECCRHTPPDVVLLGLRLPDLAGLAVYQAIRSIDARIPVVFVIGAGSAETAIDAMQEGGFDYLFKPLHPQQLRCVVGGAIEVARRLRAPAILAETLPELDSSADGTIIGACPAMREVYKAIGRVARQNVTVLITGESGTGKELVARALYHHSARAGAPFLALNCAAIPENLLESELFGHERGAFTGADRRRIGKFEQCSGGTLFLDEIGDMPLALQAKLLRVLQDQTFERVGGNDVVRTDVRLIAATHRDLKASFNDEKFRPDLYYRLSVFTIHLPPLRDRGDDLLLLLQLCLRRFNRELRREIREISPAALECLRRYSWPGNVRELESALKQAMLQAVGPVLLPENLPTDLLEPNGTRRADKLPPIRPGMTLAELEREAIRECLDRTGGNRKETASLLGISTRTLLRKVRSYRLEEPHPRGPEDPPSEN